MIGSNGWMDIIIILCSQICIHSYLKFSQIHSQLITIARETTLLVAPQLFCIEISVHNTGSQNVLNVTLKTLSSIIIIYMTHTQQKFEGQPSLVLCKAHCLITWQPGYYIATTSVGPPCFINLQTTGRFLAFPSITNYSLCNISKNYVRTWYKTYFKIIPAVVCSYSHLLKC